LPVSHHSVPTIKKSKNIQTRSVRIRVVVCALLLAAVFVTPLWPSGVHANGSPTVLLDPGAANGLNVNGKAFVLYDAQSGVFLTGRQPDTPLSPASITKVMTILLALERLKLDDRITVTKDMFATIPNDYVRLGLMEGEEISVEEALYASLLISSNDTAMALALKMSDTVSGFADLMNQRARELGCTGTTFTNPYGLAEPENVTTAHDMALILAEALKHETYSQIATTKNHLVPASNKYGTRGLTNGNRFVSTTTYAYAPYVGGKTGFTNLSGHTIVAGARKDGRTLIGVILGATSSEVRYANLIAMFNYGYASTGNLPIDPAAFEIVKSQAIAEAESQIAQAGLPYLINGSDLSLRQFTTVARSSLPDGFTPTLGEGPAIIPAGQSSTTLDYPVFATFKNGTRNQVGTLRLTLKKKPEMSAGSATTAVTKPGQSGSTGMWPSIGAILLRVGGIILAGLLLSALVIFILMQRELKRRRRRRMRPRITRL